MTETFEEWAEETADDICDDALDGYLANKPLCVCEKMLKVLKEAFIKGAASRELVCTKCGFSAPLLSDDAGKEMADHYAVCPAKMAINQIKVEELRKC